jgi:hypothetical protein
MAIFQASSGKPEDRFVNTFHFVTYTTTLSVEAAQTAARAKVVDFYLGLGSGDTAQTSAVGIYLSPWIQRLAEVRSYDLEEPGTGPGTGVNRTPTIQTFTLPASGSPGGLPEEVAVCLSYSGDAPVSPRRRGRIFLGPLITGVNLAAIAALPAVPDPTICGNLIKACKRLSKHPTADEPVWVIRSSMPEENFVVITKGYVDNAFDTQTRRGPTASTRQLWVTS